MKTYILTERDGEMKLLPKNKTNDSIREEMEKMLREMKRSDITQKDWKHFRTRYNGYAEMLQKRYTLGISPDTAIVVLANLIGLLLIINYEKSDILTSKAVQFIMRGRV